MLILYSLNHLFIKFFINIPSCIFIHTKYRTVYNLCIIDLNCNILQKDRFKFILSIIKSFQYNINKIWCNYTYYSIVKLRRKIVILIILSLILGYLGLNIGSMLSIEYLLGIVGVLSPGVYVLEQIYIKVQSAS